MFLIDEGVESGGLKTLRSVILLVESISEEGTCDPRPFRESTLEHTSKTLDAHVSVPEAVAAYVMELYVVVERQPITGSVQEW